MAEHAGSGVCIRFVDEREFKEVSVVGERRLRKNRPSGFVLEPNCAESSRESSSEDDEVDCTRTAAVSSRSRAMRPKPKRNGAATLEKSHKTKKAKVKGQVK